MKVILDCYGGDNSPFAHVEGAISAIKENSDLELVLVGKSDEINKELEKYDFDDSKIEVLNANDVISCDDKPTVAIKTRKESSMVTSFDLLKNDSECSAMVSSGSTGALLVGSVLRVGRIKGVARPALAPFLPTAVDKKMVMIVDAGANADCKPQYLEHFAIMGSAYFKRVLHVETPRVAMLSNGTEDEKGNELTKQAFELVKKIDKIEFLGNVEAREILSGNVDIVVCDGFSGNVALKSCEGAVKLCMGTIKKEIKTSFIAKIGALLMKKQFSNIKKKMDYNSFGGAVILGVQKPIIKAHGAANAVAIKASILQAYNTAKFGVVDVIKESVSTLRSEDNE